MTFFVSETQTTNFHDLDLVIMRKSTNDWQTNDANNSMNISKKYSLKINFKSKIIEN